MTREQDNLRQADSVLRNEINSAFQIIEGNIPRILAAINIDTGKAVRGYLIGDLGGDLIGRLATTITLMKEIGMYEREAVIEASRKQYLIVYEVTGKIIEKYADYFPPKCIKHFRGLLQRHEEFFAKLKTNKSFEVSELLHFSAGFHDGVQNVYKNPETYGVEDDAVKYYYSKILNVNLTP